MSLVFDLLSWICLLGGGFLVLVSGLGILRLPDFYSRLHAASITDTAGAGLILAGLAFQSGISLVTGKLIMLFAILSLTGPMGAHALAKTAHLHGVTDAPDSMTPDDELLPDGEMTPSAASSPEPPARGAS